MQTIPLEFGEQVYFFPLGPMQSQEEAYIEIQLLLEPYAEAEYNETRVRQARPDGPPSQNMNRGGARAAPR
jgi:hypothetical protein